MLDCSQPAKGNLGDPPVLDPHIQEFLSEVEPPGSRGDESYWLVTPEQSFHDPQAWVRWHTCWEETLTWWQELTVIPQKGDVQDFVRRIWASCHILIECYCATEGRNDYMPPPTLHCMGCNHYLPLTDIRSGAQYFLLKQTEWTLVYVKALQHWAKVAKPLQLGEPCQLAECVKELRKCMRSFDYVYWESSPFKRPPIALGHDNTFLRLSCGRRGSSGIWEGKEQQALKSPSPWFFSNPLSWDAVGALSSLWLLSLLPLPLVGGLACQIFSHNGCPHTSGQPCEAKANVPTQICGHS